MGQWINDPTRYQRHDQARPDQRAGRCKAIHGHVAGRRGAETREELSRALTLLGFRVLPSQTNFILAKPPVFAAQAWLQKLREKKILVRWFNHPEVKDFLRITIGTPAEAEALVRASKAILH